MQATAKRKRIDPNKLLPNVSSRFGAPKGRHHITDNPEATCRLFCVTPVDCDYDMGGAYWGFGRNSRPLYCAMSLEDDGGSFFYFIRANNRCEAGTELQAKFPKLKFLKPIKNADSDTPPTRVEYLGIEITEQEYKQRNYR